MRPWRTRLVSIALTRSLIFTQAPRKECIRNRSRAAAIANPPFSPPAASPSQVGIFRAGLWLIDENGKFPREQCSSPSHHRRGQTGGIPVVGDRNAHGQQSRRCKYGY
jgi:hypothetical protein